MQHLAHQRRLTTVLLACALGLACAARSRVVAPTTPAVAPARAGGDWPYFRIITLDTTPAGANVTEDVTRYPLAVILDRNGIDFGQARADGHDVRFFDAGGKPLPHAIESWDAEARKAAVRVLVDRVKASSADQTIVMRWGNPQAKDASDRDVFRKDNPTMPGARGAGWAKLDSESQKEGQTLLKFSEIRLRP
jgi:biopolymer transport protein ExbB